MGDIPLFLPCSEGVLEGAVLFHASQLEPVCKRDSGEL